MALENKKVDRVKDLSQLIHKSLEKIGQLREKQNDEMVQFEESEINAIEEKRKRLHYESIRIEEIRKEIQNEKTKVSEKILQIDAKVYDLTRD